MQILDPDLRLAMRLKGCCEWCHQRRSTVGHHLWTKGMGGNGWIDLFINLIALCAECHNDAENGFIQRCDLLAIVATREKTTQDEIRAAIRDIRRLPKRSPWSAVAALIPQRRIR